MVENYFIMDMKKLVFALFVLLSMGGFAQKSSYVINGQFKKGAKVFLYDYATERVLDSLVMNRGAFVMKGEVDAPRMAMLVATDGENRAMLDVVLEGGKIYADLASDSLSGTVLNERLHRYSLSLNSAKYEAELEKYYRAYMEAQNAEDKEKAEVGYDKTDVRRKRQALKSADALYAENKDNVLGAHALTEAAKTGLVDMEGLNKRLAGAASMVANYPPLVTVMKRLANLEATAVGKHYTDFPCLNYQTGEMGTLGDLIHDRVALVDFWASWCGPCRQEIKENLIRIWDEYKDKNFVLVGLDVWDKPERHKQALQQLGITYPQAIDETKNATDLYGVEGIPHIMLISAQGVILARDLRGDDIEVAVKKALGL